jgi:hypothetical protein
LFQADAFDETAEGLGCDEVTDEVDVVVAIRD